MNRKQIVRSFKAQKLRTTGVKVRLYRFDSESDWYWLHVPGRESPFTIDLLSLKNQAEGMKKRPTFVEETQEEKHKNILAYLKLAEKYNKWANKATEKLLTEIGPRIAAIGKTGYMGCGFHYAKEQTFAKLISNLAIPWQPSMNHYEKCKDEYFCTLTRKVIYDGLIEDIKKAEKGS